MKMLQKTQKKFTYALVILLGTVATFFMVDKDKENYHVLKDYEVVKKAYADVPYSQNNYQSGYGDDDDDDGDDDDDDDDGDDGPADENT